MIRTRRLTVALTVAALLATGACGGGKGKTTTTTTQAAAPGCGTSTVAGGNNSGPEVNDPGDIPDNQAFVAYSPPAGLYTVKVPEGWARTDEPNAVSFTDKFNTVRVEVRDTPAEPTPQSVGDNELPQIKASSTCFGGGTMDVLTRKGGHPVHLTYSANSPKDPVTGKVVLDDIERYFFWRNGHEAVITLSGAHGADNVDPWKIVTNSFSWK